MELTDFENNRLDEIGEEIQSGGWSNEGLVQLIELSGGFLNLETIPNYAKSNNKSYNGVKKFRNIKTIFGVKFVIDND
jgi:hypothetical protein